MDFLEGYFRRPRRWQQFANKLKIKDFKELGPGYQSVIPRFSLTRVQQFIILDHPPAG
jgi:hypothetical protein